MTMNSISMSMTDEAKPSLMYSKVYTYTGQVLPSDNTFTDYGLEITLPGMIYANALPEGQFYTIEIALDSNVWPDNRIFPCKPSANEQGIPSCNYVVHGWQTEPGDATAVRDFSYPECCPTGVSNFCSQVITTRCNPYLSDSPYRLIFDSNITTDTASEVNLILGFDDSRVLNLGSHDCSRTPIEEIQLYVNPYSISDLKSVHIGGKQVSIATRTDNEGFLLSIPSNVEFGTGVTIKLAYGAAVGPSQVCSDLVGSYLVCTFQLVGGKGDEKCCSTGDVAVASNPAPIVRVATPWDM
eukprot:gene31625-6819_t